MKQTQTLTASVGDSTERIKQITKAVMLIRAEIKQADRQAKNPFIIWYNVREGLICCHLLGRCLSAADLPTLLDNVEITVCTLYNKVFGEKCLYVEEIVSESHYEMRKDKLREKSYWKKKIKRALLS